MHPANSTQQIRRPRQRCGVKPSAEELFERWRTHGDSRALAALFDGTAAEVWRVARHLAGDSHEADDLVQATFLAAIQSASHWRREQPLLPWLLGILANTLRMARRRERRRLANQPRPLPTPCREPIEDAAHGELRELLQQRLAELPETYRTVLVLQLEHGLTAAEVAHALGRPRATVRSQLHRGLELLRSQLPAGVAPPQGKDHQPDLRRVRGALLLAAGLPKTALTPIGAILLMKKLLAVTLAVLLGGAWFVWSTTEEARPVASGNDATPLAAAATTPPVLDAHATAPSPRTEGVPIDTATDVAATVVVHTTWADGSAAAAMWVCLQPIGAHWLTQRWQVADDRGFARFADVALGSHRVRSRHGGSVDVDVANAGPSEVELRIPDGTDVRGTVVDQRGRPVTGAILVLGTGDADALEVGRSDGNGAFFLRSLSVEGRIAAFADGFSGSRAVSVDEFQKGAVELRLGDAAGVVTGRVLGADGRPLAGAWVAHGYVSIERAETVMRVELTGPSGEFRLQGVPLGQPWPLHVGAKAHAAWKGSVRVTTIEPAVVEVRLQPAVQLRGVVRNAGGEPTRGHVHVVDANAPGEGIADQRPGWSRPSLATAADGVYHFANLAPGKLLVAAVDPRGKAGVAVRMFTAQPGDALTWDPRLTNELAIHGRLLDETGAPLAGWRIVAHGDEGVPSPQSGTTGDDGAFRLTGCAPVLHKLRVYAPGDSWYAPILTKPGVEPSPTPLELRVARAAVPSCHVVGRIADDQAPGKLMVVLAGVQGRQSADDLAPGQSFTIGPVPPGQYMLQLQHLVGSGFGQMIVSGLGTCTLQPGQQHDLGDIRMPPLGEVVVELRDAAGQPVPKASLLFGLLGAPMGGSAVAIKDGVGTAQFAPGTYLPTYAGDGLCIEHEAFVVQSGQRTTVRLVAAASVHRQVRYDLEAVGWQMRAFATWRKAGKPVRRQWFDFWQERPTTIDEQFTPGAWELELELGNSSVQRFPIVVTGDDQGPIIDIKVTR